MSSKPTAPLLPAVQPAPLLPAVQPAPLSTAVQPAVQFAAVQQVNKLDIAQRHEQTLAIFAPHKEDLRPKHAQLFFTGVDCCPRC